MFTKSLLTFSLLKPLLLSTPLLAQTADGVDPACMINNSDGSQKVDVAKCADGKKVSAMAPAATDTTKKTTDATTAAASTTSAAATDILVPPDKMTGAKIMSANDFIGKTVYSKANENVGKVADLILSENGVQAVVLGVGGFLGMGSKDVAVQLSSIEVSKDGSSTKLVVNATKDQLKAAPTYDQTGRTYMN